MAEKGKRRRSSVVATTQQPTRSPAKLRPHAQAKRVPDMADAEYAALLAYIRRRGLLTPLDVTAEGIVLDGRHRLQAARELALERVPVRIVAPTDEVEYIMQAALSRRQLSPSQRAALVVELDEYEQVRAQARLRQRSNLRAVEVATLPARGERTRARVAELSGSSERTAQDVITVHDHDQALFKQVLDGQLSANTAAIRTDVCASRSLTPSRRRSPSSRLGPRRWRAARVRT